MKRDKSVPTCQVLQPPPLPRPLDHFDVCLLGMRMRGLSRPRAKLPQSAAFRPLDPVLVGGAMTYPSQGNSQG